MTQEDLDTLRELTSVEAAVLLNGSVEFLPDDDNLEDLGALRSSRTPGGIVTVRSRHPRNILVNWRRAMLTAVGIGGAVVATVAAPPVTSLALVAIALSALPQLLDLPDVQLAELHSQVVEQLWRDERAVVPCDDLRAAFVSVPEVDLERALQDLERLRVIQILQDRVHKRETLVGLA